MGNPPGGAGGNGGDGGNPNSGQFGSTEFNNTQFTSQTPQNAAVNMDPNTYQQLNDKLASMADKMASITGNVAELGRVLEAALKPLEKLNSAAEELNDDVKDTVSQYDDVKDRLRSLLELQKRSGIFQNQNIKNFRDLNAEVEQLRKDAEALSKKGFMSPDGQRIYQRLMAGSLRISEDLTDEMRKLGKTMDDALDPDVVARLRKQMQDFNRDTLTAINNMRKMSTAKDAFKRAGVRMEDLPLFGHQMGRLRPFMPGTHMAKFERMGDAGRLIKEAREAKRAGNVKAYAAAKARITPERLEALGLERESGGGFNWKAGKMFPGGTGGRAAYEKLGADISGGRGGIAGYIDRKVSAKVLAAGPAGESGFLGKMVAGGGGSFTRGIGTAIGGVGEGGLGGVAVVMGALAAPLAALEAVREFFDANVERNKKFEAALGKGGVLTGGGGAFGGMRSALAPASLNPLDVSGAYSYERNLATAKAITEAGFDISEITKPGYGPTGTGFLPGAMGAYQKNVYGTGRLAGLNEAETVQTTVKLLQQYRQSFMSTEDFFIKLSKDATAAGLSTTKYLTILDGVTEQFDRLNKSFNETVTTLELLGRTGMASADDLKNYMDALAGTGKMADVPTSTYIYSEESKQAREDRVSILNDQIAKQRNEVSKALVTAGITVPPGEIEKLNTIDDIRRFSARYIAGSKAGTKEKQDIESTLQGLQQGTVLRDIAQNFVQSGDALQFAQAMSTEKGGGLTERLIKQEDARKILQDKLRESGQLRPGETLGMAYRKRQGELRGSLLSQGLGDLLGVADLGQQNEAVAKIAAGQVQGIREGNLPGGIKEVGALYDEIQKTNPELKLQAGLTPEQKMATLKSMDPAALQEALENALEGTTTGIAKVMEQERKDVTKVEKDQADAAAQKLAKETRSTADIFGDVFERLFAKTWAFLEKMLSDLDYLTGVFGGGGKSKEEEAGEKATAENVSTMLAGGGGEKALSYWEQKKKDAKTQSEKKMAQDNIDALNAVMPVTGEFGNLDYDPAMAASPSQQSEAYTALKSAQMHEDMIQGILKNKPPADQLDAEVKKMMAMDPKGTWDPDKMTFTPSSEVARNALLGVVQDPELKGVGRDVAGVHQTINIANYNVDASHTTDPNANSTLAGARNARESAVKTPGAKSVTQTPTVTH